MALVGELADCMNEVQQRSWDGRRKLESFPGLRVVKLEPARVQRHAFQKDRSAGTSAPYLLLRDRTLARIKYIADDRVANVTEVNTDLMSSPRLGKQLERCKITDTPIHLIER